jgi:lysophospholipase L1-like esterase
MNLILRSLAFLGAFGFAAGALVAQDTPAAAEAPPKPTLFIAGDSTAQAGNPVAVGWGKAFADYFDPARVTVANRAIGGRSSRTFVTEGRWDRLVADLKAGDFVLIQFGHNDGGPIDTPPARGSLPGIGEETREIEHPTTKAKETVYTFGAYLRKMIAETRAKGATPILMSLTVRNYWNDGRVERGSGNFAEWTREVAAAEKVPFVDHTTLIADYYEKLGPLAVNAYFPRDHVHTGEDGARLNAYLAVSGLKGLREQALIRLLSLEGRSVPTAPPTMVSAPRQPPERGAEPAVFRRWLNLPEAADPTLPTVFLIGDSTVRNGRGNGYDGQFGWGDPFESYIYPARANVVNRAVGGTGARTFRTTHWPEILPLIKKGDVVILQFGHNDNGARGALPGIGDETEERDTPAGKETVRTFGAYLRLFVAEIRERGATPVICSLVPRNRWTDGRITRAPDRHDAWARAVAEAEGVAFVDLHERIATRYDALGEEAVLALFADRTVHTNWEGAVLNASIVVEGLRALPKNPVGPFQRPEHRTSNAEHPTSKD